MLIFLFLIVLFFTYFMGDRVLTFTINQKTSANVWDAVFSILGSGSMLFFVLTPVLLLFISDIPVTTNFDEFVLIRLNFRSKWLWNKILILTASIILYLVILLVIIFVTNSFALPLTNGWSEMALNYSRYSYLNPQIPATLSVTSAFIELIVLLILGWLGIGLAVITASLFFNSASLGFLFGVLIDLGGYFAYRGDIPQHFVNFFVSNHILFNFHSFGDKASLYPPYFASIIYWVIWIVLFTTIGFLICKRRDFLLGKVTS
ncbi:MAG: hypothetical protein ACP5SP_07475 [Caldisericum sp.]|uniref:hypothetical protein n=1 Tax=Caldisericum sp. TaxID=2499687 RepID=UPI003D121CBF